MTEDFDRAVRSILGKLVEARDDQYVAAKQLREYKAAKTPPEVLSEFEDVDAFLDYHHHRQGYENDLRQHENALKKARKKYADAADQLLVSCPMVCPYATSTKASGASCLEQSTSSCASRVKLLSRVPAGQLATRGQRGRPPPRPLGIPRRGLWRLFGE